MSSWSRLRRERRPGGRPPLRGGRGTEGLPRPRGHPEHARARSREDQQRGLARNVGRRGRAGPYSAAKVAVIRLTEADRRRSTVEPGTLDGPFAVLYVHSAEAVSEIRNATVHAFLVWALEPAPDGYQLFWAIHVLPVSVWTKPYLALIDPFRRWLVYPSLLRRIHEAWSREFKSAV